MQLTCTSQWFQKGIQQNIKIRISFGKNSSFLRKMRALDRKKYRLFHENLTDKSNLKGTFSILSHSEEQK